MRHTSQPGDARVDHTAIHHCASKQHRMQQAVDQVAFAANFAETAPLMIEEGCAHLRISQANHQRSCQPLPSSGKQAANSGGVDGGVLQVEMTSTNWAECSTWLSAVKRLIKARQMMG
jgi:hypothetical protein